MKKDIFKCPECGETFLEFRTEINKIKEKHYLCIKESLGGKCWERGKQ